MKNYIHTLNKGLKARRSLVSLFAILVAVLLMPQMAFGECPPDPMNKEVREFKLKFLAQEMELKEDQQKTFFDLYNQMMEEKFKIFSEVRKLESQVDSKKDATEADYQAVSNAITKAKSRDAEIEQRYDKKFSTFLTQKQLFKMKAAEEKFRNKMRQMRKHNHKKDKRPKARPAQK